MGDWLSSNSPASAIQSARSHRGKNPRQGRRLEEEGHVDGEEAKLVRQIFSDYLRLGCVSELKRSLDKEGLRARFG
jgi:hypothetical protein